MARKRYITQSIKRAVVSRDKGFCRYCGKPGGIAYFGRWVSIEHSFDHVYPECLGGETSVDNIVIACEHCNKSKGKKTLEQWGKHLLPVMEGKIWQGEE